MEKLITGEDLFILHNIKSKNNSDNKKDKENKININFDKNDENSINIKKNNICVIENKSQNIGIKISGSTSSDTSADKNNSIKCES